MTVKRKSNVKQRDGVKKRKKPSKEALARRRALEHLDDKRDLAVLLLCQIVADGHHEPAKYAWEIADAFLDEEARRHPDAVRLAPVVDLTPQKDRLAVN